MAQGVGAYLGNGNYKSVSAYSRIWQDEDTKHF